MPEPDLGTRALGWAQRRRVRWGRRNPWLVAVRVVRNSVEDRVGGLAAEMAFWALLSLVPLLVSIAALLGYAEQVVGIERLRSAQAAIVSAGSVVFSTELTTDVVRPLVNGLLREGRGGVAATGLVVALYLTSRVFTATMRALDLAYRVPERRGLVTQRLVALAMATGFVLLAAAALGFAVIGPLLGAGEDAAGRLVRWPVVLLLLVLFLAAVYRAAPNVRTSFRAGLPGAVLGVVTWTLATLALRLYLAAGGGANAAMSSEDQAVALVARVIGAVVAVLLWTYAGGLAILVGGELNAEIARHRPVPAGSVRPDAGSETMPSHRAGGAQGG